MQVPPDPTYSADDYLDLGLFEEEPAPKSWWEKVQQWTHEFWWETNDLVKFNPKAAITLAVVSFLIGALIF